MSFITLLTDFGTQDEYVGVLKGVIYSINPDVRIIDLSHEIEAQNVAQATQLLRAAFRFFPPGTIHLAVVDPGVGSSRQIIAAQFDGYHFLAPDNGLLPGLWGDGSPTKLVSVKNSKLFLNEVCPTFHGRDVFAPVAAHLSLGIEITKAGFEIAKDQLIRLPEIKPDTTADRIVNGIVMDIDRFGNLITNISKHHLSRISSGAILKDFEIRIDTFCIHGISSYYGQVEAGRVIALFGSRNSLEIAINGGSAAQVLGIKKGVGVKVVQPPGNDDMVL